MNHKSRLTQLISQEMSIPKEEIDNDTGLGKVNSWTSLAHIKLILLIEKEFNIRIPSKDITEATDFKKILNLVCILSK